MTKQTLLNISIFIGSLISFGAWFSLISLFFLFLSINYKRVKLNHLLLIFFGFLLVTISAINFNFINDFTPLTIQWNSFINNYIYFCSIIIYFAFILINIEDYKGRKNIYLAISLAIKIHVIFFIIQIITFFVLNYYIDPVQYLTGEESRYLNYIESSYTKYRFTGFYVEPSTYAGNIASLLICKFILSRNLNLKNDKFDIITIISIITTFSSAAIFIGFLLIILGVKTARLSIPKYIKILFLIIIPVLSICYYSDIIKIFESIIFKFQISTGLRFKLIDYLINEREAKLFLFGPSLFGVEPQLYLKAIGIGAEREFASLNDAGLFFFFVVIFGVISLPITIIFLIYLYLKDKSICFSLIIVLLTKISFWHITFIIYIAILINTIFNINNNNYPYKIS